MASSFPKLIGFVPTQDVDVYLALIIIEIDLER